MLPVNERFNSLYTGNLPLTKTPPGLFKLTDTILDRFCLEILPKINHKIERLDVESSSMERILQSAQYTNLRTLRLYDVAPDTACNLFSSKIFLLLIV